MKVLLTGGGTGGHITPLLAVAHELKQHTSCELIYIGEHNGKFQSLTDGHHDIDATYTVFAGKFRRYYGQSWLKRFFDIKTNVLNLRDFFYCIIGTFQAWRLLGKLKPDVVFLKGGFVGVPVGIAAHWRGVPFITHDSDALPGLANRLVGRWAALYATALPAVEYSYPLEKVRQVGVLVGSDYQSVSPKQQDTFRQQLQLPLTDQIVLVTGGSLGASRLNQAVIDIVDSLLQDHPNLRVIHQVGKGKAIEYGSYQHARLQVLEFLTPMYAYTGAADVVVTRAGANTLAELGVQGKPCIVIPNPQLTGGHQTVNAQKLAETDSAVVIGETDLPVGLDTAIRDLLRDSSKREHIGHQFQAHTITNAAAKLAELIQEVAR